MDNYEYSISSKGLFEHVETKREAWNGEYLEDLQDKAAENASDMTPACLRKYIIGHITKFNGSKNIFLDREFTYYALQYATAKRKLHGHMKKKDLSDQKWKDRLQTLEIFLMTCLTRMEDIIEFKRLSIKVDIMKKYVFTEKRDSINDPI